MSNVPGFIGVEFELSDHLWFVVDKGFLFDLLRPDGVEIVRMPEFRATANLPELLPGETMIIKGLMSAFADIGPAGREGGARSLVGDPFNLGPVGEPEIVWDVGDAPVDRAPVPLPASG